MPNPDLMQPLAYSTTQTLYFDYSDTQQFWLLTKATDTEPQTFTILNNSDAMSFYNSAPNQNYGICNWGHTQTEGSHIGNNSIN